MDAATGDLVLAPQWVIDGTGERLPPGTAVRVAGARIAAIGPLDAVTVVGARQVRLAGAALLPGMIDCHGYLSVDPNRPDPMGGMHGEDLVERAWLTARHLALDLASGVTTMRVMGEGRGLDFRARRAVAEGLLAGPALLCSGTPVCPSHSHQVAPTGGADGPDGVRAAVRRAIAQGADWIKLVVTGGVNAPGEWATTSLYTEAEVEAGIGEARNAGLPVAVAAHGGPGVRLCARLGARTVEHCAFFDDDALAAAADHDVTLVLTLARFFSPDGIEWSGRDVPGVLDKLKRARERLETLVGKAVARGVRIALGTDNMHGQLAEDVRLLASLGAGSSTAIAGVGATAAAAMGIAGRAGRLAAGLTADLLVVEGDPLADVGALGRPAAVIRQGRLASGRLPEANRN